MEQSKEIGVTTFVPVQDRDERTFLRELTHRIQKKFISSINVVSAAAVRTESSEVKVALSHVGRRVAMRSCNTRRVLSVCDTSSAGMMRRWSGSGPELLFQSTPAIQTSTCSAVASASSTSMPRYRTMLSILCDPTRAERPASCRCADKSG